MLTSIIDAKKFGKRIGFTCSAFDLLHAGHIVMLAEAKDQCDFLVVGLLSDPTNDRPTTKNKPVQSMFERWLQLQAVQYVDLVIPFSAEQDIIDMLLIIQPDVRIVGSEYKNTQFTGSDLSTHVHFNNRKHSFSSSELRKRIERNVDERLG
jgi:glycerol-3-phosphate cytidylyltransferase